MLPHDDVVGEVKGIGVLHGRAGEVEVRARGRSRRGGTEVDCQEANACWKIVSGPADAVGQGAEDESAAAGRGGLGEGVPVSSPAVVREHDDCSCSIGVGFVESRKDQVRRWEEEVGFPRGLGAHWADGGA